MSDVVMWLAQCGLIAAALTAAAWLWERGSRWSGRPARWGWFAALAGSVTLPFVVRLLPQQAWPESVPVMGVVTLDAIAIGAGSVARGGPSLETVGQWLWAALSVSVLLYASVLLVRLSRARRAWREAEVDGARVLVSRNVGPAALGLRRGVVVVPQWALELDAGLRRLMLQHEREHVLAGDPRMLLGGLALLAVMPWNPIVWLQALRLRNAIELDCDARVLRSGVDPARYGSVLLEVGRRRGSSPLVFATFAEPRLFLEERIRRIARWPLERRPLRAAALSLIALALFSSALLARVRVESVLTPVTQSELLEAFGLPGVQIDVGPMVPYLVSDTPPAVPQPRPDPRQTPYTKAPELRNSDRIMELMAETYSGAMQAAGLAGTTTLWLLVDEAGQVRSAQVSRTSGDRRIDDAALLAGTRMAFVPAELNGRAAPAWIEVPVSFGRLAHAVTVNEAGQQPAQAAPLSERPTFTPMTQRPELTNPAGVQQILAQNYPPLLRDAGIGGTTVLWFFIDDNGAVVRTQLHTSSGYPALDQAATRVAEAMRFSPAKNRDRAVGVWVEIPIVFTARGANASAAEPALIEARQRVETEARVRLTQEEQARRDSLILAGRMTAALSALEVPAEAIVVSGQRGVPAQGIAELLNRAEVQRALLRNYPPLLRDAGVTGTTLLNVTVSPEGVVQATSLNTPSGFPALDEAAARVAAQMRFRAVGGEARTVVVPVSFGEEPVTGAAGRAGVVSGVRDAASTVEIPPLPRPSGQQQAGTPLTRRPDLKNATEVQRVLVRNYPPVLRDAGIGGTVQLWFYISESGDVTRLQLSRSSGYPALDEAAMRVASVMQFTSPMNGDRAVNAWVEIPIVFTAK